MLTGSGDRLEDAACYEVCLEVFRGPVDLLLQLIQRRELDITVVSIAAVTDQYMAYLQALNNPDPDQIADFLVMAARLLAIKAIALLARPEETPAEEQADADDLVRALREYQLFQRAATQLREWEAEGRQSFARAVPTPPIILPQLDGLHLDQLVSVVRQRLAAVMAEPVALTPPARQYTIVEKIAVIEAGLAIADRLLFADLLHALSPATEIIVTFLAVLELLKARRITVGQDALFGDIVIRPAESTVGTSGDQRDA